MKLGFLLFGLLALVASGLLHAYPLDDQETGIRRLEGARLSVLKQASVRYPYQPSGALLKKQYVQLRLLKYPNMDLPKPDPAFTAEVTQLLGANKDAYGIAVLDLSDPAHPRYAEYRGEATQNVGSVGKLVAVLGLFQALADVYPNDIDARKRVLHDTVITADSFIRNDSHDVHFWNRETRTMVKRPLEIGDQGNLWEWLDWMMSPSSNAAASTVMKQAMLIRHFGTAYPVSDAEASAFFRKTPKSKLRKLFIETFEEPITRNGLNLKKLRQGSFFTRYGKGMVPGVTSYGSARALLLYCLRMEEGRLVDPFSSREIKRLMYVTERRIRYASSMAFLEAAVYFKSGSLYSCRPEPGFECEKYHGNVLNSMNSVAIVEAPAGVARLHYIVSLISNVLRKNSAVDHQTLGTRLHRLIEKAHPAPKEAADDYKTFSKTLIGYDEKGRRR